MNSKASDVSEGLREALGGYASLEDFVGNLVFYTRQVGTLGEAVRSEFGTAAKVIRALSPPLPSLEVERLRAEAFAEAAKIALYFHIAPAPTSRAALYHERNVKAIIHDVLMERSRALSALPLDGGL